MEPRRKLAKGVALCRRELIVGEGIGRAFARSAPPSGRDCRAPSASLGLNRAILDATPGSFLTRLSTKAQEAGCELIGARISAAAGGLAATR
jgi:hypothetical protein